MIEKNLGYNVNLLTIDEIPAWPAMVQGKVSAVMEVWGHSPLYAQYVKGNHKVVDAGLEGPNGNIGWYVPTYLVQQHPELKTWQGVKKDWKMFVTPQSSPQGQFLDGSPSYVTNDQALVKNLGINLKVVFAGTEAAQLTEIESDYKAKKPVLFYWYTPQYQNAIYKFSQVSLPTWTPACGKLKPAAINCAYPPYHLYKVMACESPDAGSDGGELHQAVQLDVGRPELGLLQPRREAHEQQRSSSGVRELAPGSGQVVALELDGSDQDRSAASGHVGPVAVHSRGGESRPSTRSPMTSTSTASPSARSGRELRQRDVALHREPVRGAAHAADHLAVAVDGLAAVQRQVLLPADEQRPQHRRRLAVELRATCPSPPRTRARSRTACPTR